MHQSGALGPKPYPPGASAFILGALAQHDALPQITHKAADEVLRFAGHAIQPIELVLVHVLSVQGDIHVGLEFGYRTVGDLEEAKELRIRSRVESLDDIRHHGIQAVPNLVPQRRPRECSVPLKHLGELLAEASGRLPALDVFESFYGRHLSVCTEGRQHRIFSWPWTRDIGRGVG